MAQETPRVNRQLVVLEFLPNHSDVAGQDLRKRGKENIASRQRCRMLLTVKRAKRQKVSEGKGRKSQSDFRL